MPRKTKQNKITSPEKTALINKSNIRLKDDFLAYLAAAKKSPGTIKGYDNDLLIVFTYMLDNLGNKDFQALTKRDIISIQNWLIANGNSPARIRRIKSSISSLSNFIESILDGEPEFAGFRSIVRKIESPVNQQVREKTVWSDDELLNILDILAERGEHDKACLLALAMYSGRRKSELCRFRVSDFSESNLVCDGALYKSAPIKTKGQGGGKYISCYTLAKFKRYFDAWMAQRAELGIESEWLFPSRSNPTNQISISTLNSWSDYFSRISGKPAYLHSLRHYFTTSLVRAGLPDSVIQTIVAWQSADMVKVYTDIDADEQIGMYFKNGEICAPETKGLKGI